MSIVKLDYNIDFSKYVKYDELSQTYLSWAIDFRKMKTGQRAGSFGSGGKSAFVSINNIRYLCHRVIWKLHHGSIDQSLVIDHINGDPRDNRIENLSLVTIAENLRNKSILAANKSGITGVFIHSVSTCPSYIGKCSIGNKHFGRSFSISKYGEEQAKQLAVTWRKNKLKELEQQGIFYSERHGT